MRRLPALLLCLALAACAREGSLVLVTVEASPEIAAVASVDVDSTIGSAKSHSALALAPVRSTPITFGIDLDPDRSGSIDVAVTLRDAAGGVLGHTGGTATIVPGGTALLTVRIGAADGGVDGATPPDLVAVDGGGSVDLVTDEAAPDLAMADLAMADLAMADLSMADLSMADLAMADLSMADLAMADLSMADLSMADLSMADLSMADLALPDLVMPDLAVVSSTLATAAPRAFLLDTGTLFWLDGTGSSATLRAVATTGGAARAVIQSGAMPTEPPFNFAATAQTLLYGDANGNVYSVPKTGGGATTIVSSSGIGMQALATDGTNVFWTVSVSGVGSLDRASIANGIVSMQDTSSGQRCRMDVLVVGSTVYFTEDGCGTCTPGGVPRGSIWAASTGGGSASQVAGPRPHPAYLATDGTNVYWTEPCDGNVVKLAPGSGTVTTLATGQPQATGIATDGTAVYFTAPGDGTLRKVPVAGGSVATLASGLSNPLPVAVDATSVYVGEWVSGGTIRKLTPK